jgi:hypothetical protein
MSHWKVDDSESPGSGRTGELQHRFEIVEIGYNIEHEAGLSFAARVPQIRLPAP